MFTQSRENRSSRLKLMRAFTIKTKEETPPMGRRCARRKALQSLNWTKHKEERRGALRVRPHSQQNMTNADANLRVALRMAPSVACERTVRNFLISS